MRLRVAAKRCRHAPEVSEQPHSALPARHPPPAAAAYGEPRPLSAQGSIGSLDAYAATAAAPGHVAAAALPPSGIYTASCRAFTWPLLAPQSQVGSGARGAATTTLTSPQLRTWAAAQPRTRLPPHK